MVKPRQNVDSVRNFIDPGNFLEDGEISPDKYTVEAGAKKHFPFLSFGYEGYIGRHNASGFCLQEE